MKDKDMMIEPVSAVEPYLRVMKNVSIESSGMQKVSEIVTKVFSSSASATERINQMSETLQKTVSVVQSMDFNRIACIFEQISEALSKIATDIHIPDISEDRKQQLIQSQKTWGVYGWTKNPCDSHKAFFDIVPDNKKAADFKMLQQCSPQMMQEIFLIISKQKRVKKSDYREAVFDFEHKQYKSCALILFSLIDAMLIRLQKVSSLDGKRRGVGKKAIVAAQKRAQSTNQSELFTVSLFYKNLFSCLNTVFDDGKDFKVQTDVINRNFVAHGMMRRQVTRKDCIQLFFLYYNMLELLERLY